MFQSIFGNVDFGDMKAMSDWSYAHAGSHSQLIKAGGSLGYFVPDQLLSSADDITDDWFGRHALQHLALARVSATISGAGQNTSMPTAGIFSSVEEWKNPGKFYDWMQQHDKVHSLLNRAFGITA